MRHRPTNQKNKVVCLLGPTGSGKSTIAKHLAATYKIGIINIDSRQIYYDFPIITDQPTLYEKSVCPHFLYGILPISAKTTTGAYIGCARQAISDSVAENRIPVLVGGTGLYIRSLFHGIAEIPPVDPSIFLQLQKTCQEKGLSFLYILLSKCDPAYAAHIHPNDRQRIFRGLEVFEGTGHSLSWWHTHSKYEFPYDVLKIGVHISLSDLTPFLSLRIKEMLKKGAVAEVMRAYKICPDTKAPGWSGIGCLELLKYCKGMVSLKEACQRWEVNTRAYAKRQLTWFAKEREIYWVSPDEVSKCEKRIMEFLNN